MQLSAMTGRVSQRLSESIATFYPTAEITAAINEAQRFFCLLTLGLETTASWAIPAATPTFHMLTIFADWIVPLRITTATGSKVRPSRIDDLAALNPLWKDSPGAPVRYNHQGCDFLSLYQQPAATGTTLQVTYARAPVPLVNPTDVPEIPPEYHPRLVDYAIYRCRQVEGAQEFAKTLPMFDEFLNGVQHYGDFVRARNLGSRYDAVPFELRSFDRSKLLKMRSDLPPGQKVMP